MSEINHRRIYDALIGQDFSAFIFWAFAYLYPGQTIKANWHVALLADRCVQVMEGRTKRLVVCAPPRHLKSFITTICFPAFILGRDPSAKVINISYAQDLAEGFAHQCRKLMESEQYKRSFPRTRIDPKRCTKRDIGTTRNGHRMATSVHGKLTGLGGEFLIIDDPMKADDAFSDTVREAVNLWFDSTLSSRLDNPKTGRILVVAQRLHVDDLAGRLMERGGWEKLILPLVAYENQTFAMGDIIMHREAGHILHEAHFGEEEVEHLRATISSALFEAQWNQRPVPSGGYLFKLEWLNHIEEPHLHFDYIVQSWDTALATHETNDYTVCATFGLRGKEIHLIDVHRVRISFTEQVKLLPNLREKWNADLVIVEASHGGLALYDSVRHSYPSPPLWLKHYSPKLSKVERAEWQTPKLEQGRFWIPKHAEWRPAFERELMEFPKGKHDDQVDAVTQFLAALDTGAVINAAYAGRMSRT